MNGKEGGRRRRRRRGFSPGRERQDVPPPASEKEIRRQAGNPRSEQARPGQARLGQTRPGQAYPGQTGPGQARRAAGGERTRWMPPKLNTDPFPEPECPWCGQAIRDLDAAIQDRNSGKPVHFDCVLARLSEAEKLEKGDVLSYIGGGRFGIVHFNEHYESRNRFIQQESAGRVFTIKKIVEWEDKENRADWRGSVADHYSLT